ncbi:MAG: hypothetical protein JXR50_08935 [Prolixibacteraceae bacterium]|nr:hypothetical protein [Prolixibacteraceae bacterium]MBN2649850.1 hypothetical protein [Prolixibacteraceae bacterium]
MKHLLLYCIFATALPTLLQAQSYNQAIGVRTGSSRSIFYEMSAPDLSTYRFALNWRDGGRNLSAMKIFKKYKMDNLPDHLTFYYGFGAHAGYVSWAEKRNFDEERHYASPIAGLNAIIGLSYDFTEIPVSLTIDASPHFDYGGPFIVNISPAEFCIGAILYF